MEWISVKDRLPDNINNVLCLTNTLGKRPIQFIGSYTKGHEIAYYDEDYDGEYDPIEDKDGQLYLKPGWYECEEQIRSDFDEYWIIRDNVTHWMPLPEPPKP